MEGVLFCNKCLKQFENGVDKAISTMCGHLICSECSEATFPAMTRDATGIVAQCPCCGEDLRKSNLKLVTTLAPPSSLKMSLYGQAPETIMSTALSAIMFYLGQQGIVADCRQGQLLEKINSIKAESNKKLQEFSAHYQNVKRKHQVAQQEKAELAQESKELQEKYRQKAKQNQELQRMFKELQAQNDNNRQQQRPAGGGYPAGGPALGSPSQAISNQSGGQLITTTTRQAVFAMAGGGGGTPDFFKPSNMGAYLGGMGSSGGGGMGMQPINRSNQMQAPRPLTAGAPGMRMGDLPGRPSSAGGGGSMRPTMLQPGGGGRQQRGMVQQQQQQQQVMPRQHMLQGLGGSAGRPQQQQYAPRAQGGFNPAQLSG